MKSVTKGKMWAFFLGIISSVGSMPYFSADISTRFAPNLHTNCRQNMLQMQSCPTICCVRQQRLL